MSAVGSFPDARGGVEKNIGIFGRPNQRLCADRPGRRFRGRRRRSWSHISLLSRHAVEDRHLSAINEIRILGIRSCLSILLNVYRMPVVESDLSVHAAAVNASRSRILLPAAQPVRE